MLFLGPGLRLVEHGYIPAHLQLSAVEPHGALVGLAVLRVVDPATLILVAFLCETREDVYPDELTALQLLVWIVHVELPVALLQPDDLAVQSAI